MSSPDVAARPAPSEDLSLLRSFASGGGDRAARTAVAVAAARAVAGHNGEAQAAARDALAALLKDPPCDAPDALPPLLAAAAAGGTRVGPAFRVGTVAWKVLVAAVVGAPRPAVCELALRKRILLASGVGVRAILDEILRVFSSAEGGDGEEAAEAELTAERYIKVLRFHSANMARLARRFLEQRTVLCAVDACVAVTLRNFAAVLSATVVDSTAVSAKAAADLNANVVAPAASAARAVLIMCCSSAEASSALQASYSVSARGAVAQLDLAGRLLAVAYLIRCAEAVDAAAIGKAGQCDGVNTDGIGGENSSGKDRDGTGADSGGKEDGGQAARLATNVKSPHQDGAKAPFALGELLRGASVSALLPLVLHISRYIYSSAYRTRTRAGAGGHTLAAVAAAAAADCAARAVPDAELQLQLLHAAASRHALVAHAAGDALVAIAPAAPAILDSVVGLARLALAANSSSADCVWVPLAARICSSLWRELPERTDEHSIYLFRAGTFAGVPAGAHGVDAAPIAVSPPSSSSALPSSLPPSLAHPSATAVEQSQVQPSAPRSTAQDLADEAGLRVLAAICSCGPPDTPPPDFIFTGIGFSRDAVARFCKQTLLGGTTPAAANSGVAAACAMLLPHVTSPRAAAGAALAVLKRSSASTRLAVAALNSINVAAAPLGPLAAALPRALARHGPPLVPAALAFVARALSANPPPPSDIAGALRTSVSPFPTDLPGVKAPELAAVRYHAATISGLPAISQGGLPGEHDAVAFEEALMLGGGDGPNGAVGNVDEVGVAEAAAGLAGAVAALATALSKQGSTSSTTIPVPVVGELRALAAAVPALAAVAQGGGMGGSSNFVL